MKRVFGGGAAMLLTASTALAVPAVFATPAQAYVTCTDTAYAYSAAKVSNYIIPNWTSATIPKGSSVSRSVAKGTKFSATASVSAKANLGGLLKAAGLKASVSANASVAFSYVTKVKESYTIKNTKFARGKVVLGLSAKKIKYNWKRMNLRDCKVLDKGTTTITVIPKSPSIEYAILPVK